MNIVNFNSFTQLTSDSRLIQLLDLLPLGIQECDVDGKITYSNMAHHTILNFNVGELIDHYVWDFQVDEAQKQEVKEYLLYLVDKQPIPEPYITTNITNNGQKRVLEITWDYLRNEKNDLMGFISIISDITEKKRKETDLIENQLLLKEAQSIAHTGHWELDSLTMKAKWSEEIFHILGIDPTSEAGPELLATLLHPDDKEQLLSSLQDAIADGKKHHLEYRIIRPDAEVRWVECEAMQILDDNGKIVKLRGVFKDITEHKKIENELSNTLATLKNVINSTPDLIFVKNHQLQTILCNKAYANAVGKSSEQMYGHTDIENGWDPKLVNGIPEKGIRGFKHDDRDALSGITVNKPHEPTHVQGELRIFDTYKRPLKDAKDNIIGVLSVSRDITEKKQTEDRLKLLSNVFTYASEGISITDAHGNILDVNQAFTHITGYSREEIIGKKPKILQSGVHDRVFYKMMWQEINEKGSWYGEIWNRHKKGDIYAEKININEVKDAKGKVQNYIAMFSDITNIKKHQEHLEHMAHYDALTNLPNRTLLSNRLASVIAQTNRNSDHLALAYLDLDGFKEVNDTYGHAIGDQLLVSLTDRLKKHLRDRDILARIGGDEFVIVLSSLSENKLCIPLLQRLLAAASKPILIGDNILHISASIGVTFFPQAEKIDADQLLRQADQAMYVAKQSGKNCYKIFDMSQEQSVKQRHESLGRIQQALESDEFVMFYQPKVNMNSGEITGFEALIRWLHPEKGLLPPIEFLPLIEDDFISVELGDWVISNTLSQLNNWHQSGLKVTISINISALHLQQPHFVKNLEQELNKYPEIENHYFELEILETSALDDINQVSEIMNSCHDLGVHFALDDFGTGYSSLTYLKRLPASTLKIDQTFVRDMMDVPEDLAIIEGILGLAHAFKRQPIAEGVETIEHGILLLKLGCDFAQGYSIAKPMPAGEIISWIKNWQCPSVWINVKRVGRDETSLLHAAVEQKAWVKLLELYVQDKTIVPPVDIDKCRFGKWLDKTGKPKYGHLSTFKQVDLAHQKLHSVAHQVIKYKNQNDNKKLQDKLSLLKQTSSELLELFDQLFE
jgi:diguanylate cyclase (GGDEF)-like protein/PAS domain S-box-containing protein